ncbi:hypothetical protein IT575_07580 [bacterium]|nr:hypothetical protein [bacterium]
MLRRWRRAIIAGGVLLLMCLSVLPFYDYLVRKPVEYPVGWPLDFMRAPEGAWAARMPHRKGWGSPPFLGTHHVWNTAIPADATADPFQWDKHYAMSFHSPLPRDEVLNPIYAELDARGFGWSSGIGPRPFMPSDIFGPAARTRFVQELDTFWAARMPQSSICYSSDNRYEVCVNYDRQRYTFIISTRN